MKKTLLFTAFALLGLFAFSQVPHALKYQTVVRNPAGEIVANQNVSFLISIIQGELPGTVIYNESHLALTNEFGLINLDIGRGIPVTGDFTTIDWNTIPCFIKTEFDPDGGTNYVTMGTTELLSVPYAFYSASTGDTSLWRRNESTVYYDAGRVGIGTSNPQELLELYGNNSITGLRASWGNSYNGLYGDFRHLGSGGLHINSQAPGGTSGWADISFQTNGTTKMFLESAGNMGIGTSTPSNLLELSSVAPKLYFNRQNSISNLAGLYWRSTDDNFEGAFVRDNATGTFQLYSNITGGTPRMVVTNDGNIGIGTTEPETLLQITTTTQFNPGDYSGQLKGSILMTLSGGTQGHGKCGTALAFSGINTGRRRAAIASIQTTTDPDQVGLAFYTHQETSATNDEVTQQMIITHDGSVGIGTTSPASRLDVRGNVTVRDQTTGDIAVELGTGLDYAEGFNVAEKENIGPGTVLCIDPDNPGMLKISMKANDNKVAGIVTGANNLASGVILGTGNHDFIVALAGRVYCNADATYDAIETGDLLTTSEIQGYAKKVVNIAEAQGAILGKAMQSLEKGKKGQILVLVTLQ